MLGLHFFQQMRIALAETFETNVKPMVDWKVQRMMILEQEVCASPERGHVLATVEQFQ
jgi:hypothetical protein